MRMAYCCGACGTLEGIAQMRRQSAGGHGRCDHFRASRDAVPPPLRRERHGTAMGQRGDTASSDHTMRSKARRPQNPPATMAAKVKKDPSARVETPVIA